MHLNESNNLTNVSQRFGESSAVIEVIDDYVVPSVVIFGIITNTLTFVILLRPPFKKCSSSIYINAYCLSACCALVMGPGKNWVLHIGDYKSLKTLTDATCKVLTFLENHSNAMPLWFLAGATIDRFIAWWYSRRAEVMCTVFIAKIGVTFTVVGVTAVAVHLMWTFSLFDDGSCSFEFQRNEMYLGFWTIYLLLFLFPILIIFILLLLILFYICIKGQTRRIVNASGCDADFISVVFITSLFVLIIQSPLYLIYVVEQFYPYRHILLPVYSVLSYISLLGYLPSFFIIFILSAEFRDGIKVLVIGIWNWIFCIKRQNTNIELKHMNGEYNSVPSTSTCV